MNEEKISNVKKLTEMSSKIDSLEGSLSEVQSSVASKDLVINELENKVQSSQEKNIQVSVI